MARPKAQQFNEFFVELDKIDALRGAGVGFIGDSASTVVRQSVHSSGLKTYVLVGETEEDLDNSIPVTAAPPPSLTAELIGLGMNCGSAVLAWSVMLGSAGSVPLTGGSSLLVTGLAWTATASSTVQCGNSILRSLDIAVNNAEWTTNLDSQDWYVWAEKILDLIGLIGVGLSAMSAVRAARALRAVSNRSWREILKGMNRAERKRLTKELIRMQNKAASGQKIKQLIRDGKFPARFAAEEITDALFKQLRDAASATLSFAGSAFSGNVKSLYVSIVQE